MTRPPLTADERTQLAGWLDLQRSFVRMKCAGLSEADAHRKVLPTSPLMTMAGIVAHLRWNEYDEECARSNAIVATLSLDALEQGPTVRDGGAASLRYVLCHMIEETARHVGHLDIIRELLDGSTGYDR